MEGQTFKVTKSLSKDLTFKTFNFLFKLFSGAQSVKEVWINSCKKQATSKPANVTQLESIANSLEANGLPFHPENPEGSMIKELLLKTRIINLTPVSSTSSPIR